MELLDLINCACGAKCLPPEPVCGCAHPIVKTSLIWAIAAVLICLMICIVILIYLFMKNRIKKTIAESEHAHELALKEKSFEHEKHWHEEKKAKLTNDQIEALNNEIEKLNNGEKVKQCETDLKQKDVEIDLLKKQLELYQKTVGELNVELRTKESK